MDKHQHISRLGPKHFYEIVKLRHWRHLLSENDSLYLEIPVFFSDCLVQGPSWQTVFFELPLKDRNMEVIYFWKVSIF